MNKTPHLQGIFDKAEKIAEALGRTRVDENILFYSFISSPNYGTTNILNKCDILKSDIHEESLKCLGKKRNKVFNGGFTPNVKKLVNLAEDISLNQFGMDYLSPEVLFLAFFADGLIPKALSNYFGISDDFSKDKVSQLFEIIASYLTDKDHLQTDEKYGNKKEEELEPDELPMFEDNPILSRFAVNLNICAENGDFEKVVDFDNKIDELATILCRKKKPNAIIVGKAGCGKTTLVQGLANRIISGDAPDLLCNKVIYSVNLSSMVAGTQYRGQFEERLEDFVNEAKKYSNLILFIDEIHTLVGAGGGSASSLEASNILKPELASGTISCIGATTINEYTNTIKRDSALDRRFERVVVSEPSKFKMEEMLPEILSFYEEFHGVVYGKEFISNIVDFCERFLPNRAYPDKAVDIIDHCGAQAKVKFWETGAEIKDMIKSFSKKEESGMEIVYSDIKKYEQMMSSWEKKVIETKPEVELQHLKDFFASKGSILNNVFSISELCKDLKEEYRGNKDAINLLEKKLKTAAMGLSVKQSKSSPDIFLMHGDKFVGKTFFCEIISKFLDKNSSPVLSYNGTQLSDYYAPNKIISNNYENTSMAEKIVMNPNTTIIIDDFGKVNNNCYGLLQQIFKEGFLQMSNGDIADFSNCKIFLFCDSENKKNSLGFNTGGESKEETQPSLDVELLKLIKNRIKLVHPRKRALRRILFNRLNHIKKISIIQGFEFNFDFKFLKTFVDDNYDQENPIKKLIEAIEEKITSKIEI